MKLLVIFVAGFLAQNLAFAEASSIQTSVKTFDFIDLALIMDSSGIDDIKNKIGNLQTTSVAEMSFFCESLGESLKAAAESTELSLDYLQQKNAIKTNTRSLVYQIRLLTSGARSFCGTQDTRETFAAHPEMVKPADKAGLTAALSDILKHMQELTQQASSTKAAQ